MFGIARRIATPWPRTLIGAASLGALAAATVAAPKPCAAEPERRTFEPCPEVACKSKEELLAMFSSDTSGGSTSGPRRRRHPAAGDNSQPTAEAVAAGATHENQAAQAVATSQGRTTGCPPDRQELGVHAWSFLHTMAAYYPDHPTEEEKAAARGMIDALRLLYPCAHCRAQLVEDLKLLPVEPALRSRADFSLWMCQQHNLVNAALGLKTYPCTLAALDGRWRTGRPDCWGPARFGLAAAGDAVTAEESLGRLSADEEDSGLT